MGQGYTETLHKCFDCVKLSPKTRVVKDLEKPFPNLGLCLQEHHLSWKADLVSTDTWISKQKLQQK